MTMSGELWWTGVVIGLKEENEALRQRIAHLEAILRDTKDMLKIANEHIALLEAGLGGMTVEVEH